MGKKRKLDTPMARELSKHRPKTEPDKRRKKEAETLAEEIAGAPIEEQAADFEELFGA